MKIGAIIQARMGSTRLPGKVLLRAAGKTLLEHQIDRTAHAKLIHEVVVATTTRRADDAIARLCKRIGVSCFRGSEEDVLDRVYRCAVAHDFDVAVRLTADDPLQEPEVMDQVIRAYLDAGCDYASNTIPPTYPDGLDVEVMSIGALQRAWRYADLPPEREHVTPYIKNHPEFFKLVNVGNGADRSVWYWAVDRVEDYRFVRDIFENLSGIEPYFTYRDVLDYLAKKTVRPARAYRRTRPVKITNSNKLWTTAKRLIPAGTMSLSKSPTSFVDGATPKYVVRGKGCVLTDVDGNTFIDYGMALGPIVLGYNHPVTDGAVKRQLKNGIIFSLLNPLEVELAQLLSRLIPHAEMVRFGKNGSDATTIAVKVARAFTGRDMVALCGYHGWHDWYNATTERNKGVPQAIRDLSLTFEYNNIESLKNLFRANAGRIACVIMEPVHAVEPQGRFLSEVASVCRENGALFILDEIKMGFRIAIGGGGEHYGVEPDLSVFGKSMANGMPISAIAGRRKYMMELDSDVFYSFTFAGETLSLAASLATIRYIRQKKVIPHLWKVGEQLKNGLTDIVREHGLDPYVRCTGLGPYHTVNFLEADQDPWLVKSLFSQECFKRGVFFAGYNLMCHAHTPRIIARTLSVYDEVAGVVKAAIVKNDVRTRIQGVPMRPVFKRL